MNTVVSKLIASMLLLSAVLFAGTQTLCAQEEQQPPAGGKTKPAGAAAPIPVIGPGDQDDQTGTKLVPDMTPLTGVQTPTVGSPELLHSYWVPGATWSGSIQSNTYNQSQNTDWLMNNYLVGNLSLLKAWPHSQFSVNYSGGGFFSTDSTQGNGSYHQLALSQTFHGNRWQLELLDQFSYLPESSFGFSGASGLSSPGSGGSLGPVIPGLNNSYVPNQSIFASLGPRYSNSSSIQLNYMTSRRGSITLSGTYGLLTFVDAGNVDNDSVMGTIGYNYSLNRTDTIGAFYKFSAFHFAGQPQAIGDHSFNFAYGKKITGRTAVQLYVGPDFTTSRIATNGSSSSHGVNAGANITYALAHGGLNLAYSHGISGGSGVLTGTSSDLINFGADHRLTRLWSGQFNAGYARNSALSIVTPTITGSLVYSAWTVGGGFRRPLGRNTDFAINYSAQIPDYSNSVCSGPTCSNNRVFHFITINLQWRARPFVLP
ncbi:MAG TPA: hypothetical protein VIW67_07775 [Terriglobales bacterium]